MIVATAPEFCQKCDLFLRKRMKEIFAYVLEFMLTFDTMQNTSPLMCILKAIQVFSYFIHSSVFWVFCPSS